MFRKPKKKPRGLRGKSSDASSVDRSNPGESAGRKRCRARSKSSSSSEEDNNNNDEERTSDLLQQIRQERDDAKFKKTSSALLNKSSTATRNKSKNSNDWMHQYKSNDSRVTANEMATRTAEYHPKGKADDKAQPSSSSPNAHVAALQPQPRNKFLAGPLKATTFVRTTVRFDYQPDICKDYKETGFCGFGDSCIYLHDRGDTMAGWQIEAEYEAKKKEEEKKKCREMDHFMNSMMSGERTQTPPLSSAGKEEQKEMTPDAGIPFACHICRGPFQNPIVTTCAHYFCETCLLAQIREAGSGCPICLKDTHGVMNYPQKLFAKKRRAVGRDGKWEQYLEQSKGDGDGDDVSKMF